ncbi:hypothetical protein PFISCL1PPCAC_20898, partial [Pristionchus fissidentatus]
LEIPNINTSGDSIILPLGDGNSHHDLWILCNEGVQLITGRASKFKKRQVWREWGVEERKSSNVVVSAAYSMTTRTNNDSSSYLDIICAATHGQFIGIFDALHMDGNPADVIQYADWTPCRTVNGLYAEIVQNEQTDEFCHDISIRVFAIDDSGKITVSIGRLIVNMEGLRCEHVTNLCHIFTDVDTPRHFVVTNIHGSKKNKERNLLKFAIITGRCGSQVVRICPKKLDPLTPSELRLSD